MSTMNVSLPQALKSFVDEQVSERGYGTSSEYVRELIRKDQDRQRLRGLLLAGAASAPAAPVDVAFFDSLRLRVRQAAKPGRRGLRPNRSSCALKRNRTSTKPLLITWVRAGRIWRCGLLMRWSKRPPTSAGSPVRGHPATGTN
jgi:antitoxin ParD1/3/4